MTNTKRRPKKCSFIAGGDRCERDAVSGGFCHGHDAQARRHPDQDLVPLHAAKERLCEFEGCGRRHNSHGLCSGHKQQLRARDWDRSQLTPLQRYAPQDNKDVARDDGLRPCVFPDCPRVVGPKGLCHGHYQQWRRAGQPLKDRVPDVTDLQPLRIPAGKCTFQKCGKPHQANGLCKGHYNQAREGRGLATLRQAATQCRFDDCDRDPHARGLCGAHYQQLLRGQPLSPIGELPYPEGLSDKELVEWICSDEASTLTEGGCRIWNGCTDPLRYGRIPRWGKHELLHRFIFITANGVDRATFGDSVHHACHNRGCVNIDHLEAATTRENALEMHERHSLQKTIGLQRKVIALKDRLIAQLQVEIARLEDSTKQLGDDGIE